MAYKLENDCYGCSECRNCGRNRYYKVCVCDECGDDAMFRYNEKDYCESCLEHQLIEDKVIEEENDGYNYDGKYFSIFIDCAEQMLDEDFINEVDKGD